MLAFLTWWLIIQMFGLAAFPLSRHIFRWLPDGGYAFSKTAGLLLVSYLLWFGASTRLLTNSTGGIVFALLVVAGISAWLSLARGWKAARLEMADFWREHRAHILTAEALFLLAFAGWTVVRAYAPDKILPLYGEKYMEIAFLNGVLNSLHFPPLDPWLSGFGISYYYFGYVMMGIMTRLSGAIPTVGFDLYDALIFALTALTAYGVVSNLIIAARGTRFASRGYGLLGALFVTCLGNLEGLLEALHSARLLPDAFWTWIDIPGLAAAGQSGSLYPGHGWWWWRASRVLTDLDLQYQPVPYQPIDEFPGFSFLLGDNHPHKLALPFVLLAVGLALNLLLKAVSPVITQAEVPAGQGGWRRWAAWLTAHRGAAWFYLFYAIALGGLAFLNTWDFPIYLGLVLLAYAAGTGLGERRLDVSLLMRTVALGAGLGIASIVLYFFFYASFSSQAGGILPYIFPPTRLPQYLVMFGPFVFVLVFFIPLAARDIGRAEAGSGMWRQALRNWLWITGLAYGLYLLILLAGILVMRFSSAQILGYLQNYLGDRSAGQLLAAIFLARLKNPWVYLLLSGLIALAFTAGQKAIQHTRDDLPLQGNQVQENGPASQQAACPAVIFVLLLALVGIALTLVVEFLYLRDVFGMRMNTIFKFYFQAWILMALAAAFGAWWVGQNSGPAGRGLFRAGFVVLVAAGLVYPSMGIASRVEGFQRPPNLDAAATIAGIYPNPWASIPDDWAAIQWLKEHVNVEEDGLPILLEGVNGSYQASGRVSAFTGFPALLGWPGHENQWRGNYIEPGKREPVIARIYTTPNSTEALALLREWRVRYVILGDPERQYISKICGKPETPCNTRQAEDKFAEVLTPVFTQGSITVYQVP